MLLACSMRSAATGLITGAPYQPTWASLDTRVNPAWYSRARFGIKIHWYVSGRTATPITSRPCNPAASLYSHAQSRFASVNPCIHTIQIVAGMMELRHSQNINKY